MPHFSFCFKSPLSLMTLQKFLFRKTFMFDTIVKELLWSFEIKFHKFCTSKNELLQPSKQKSTKIKISLKSISVKSFHIKFWVDWKILQFPHYATRGQYTIARIHLSFQNTSWDKLPFCLLDVGCHLGMPACDWSKFWPKPAWVQTESESHLWLAFWTLQCSALKSFLNFEFWVC